VANNLATDFGFPCSTRCQPYTIDLIRYPEISRDDAPGLAI